jgi:pimeloyl-ACP methyl ester carboxylesterase
MKTEAKTVRASGIDIHYVECGSGPPLVLLHGGLVTTNPIWAGHPLSYTPHLDAFAEHFRVIAPDTRGAGRTRHGDGPVTFDLLADDVVALIDALHLDGPRVCGFSEGGTTATIVGLRNGRALRAIVNDAGYDLLDPESPSFPKMRAMFGGNPAATEADPDAMQRSFDHDDNMRASFRLMQADQDGAQGPGAWKQYLRNAFHRVSRSAGYPLSDLRKIPVPTLLLVGDRDPFCPVEAGVAAFRELEAGELAVLPRTGHVITAEKVRASIEFLRRTT